MSWILTAGQCGPGMPVPASKVDQVLRTCTVGLRKETKAREIYNKDGVVKCDVEVK